MKNYLFIPVLIFLVFSCKTQQPPQPRYVDYVPFFDQTGREFLKTPSNKGVKLDSMVLIWSNLHIEKAIFNETLLIEEDFEPDEAELIIDIDLINEKPPLIDTLLLVTEILFTDKMVEIFFPIVADSFLLQIPDSVENNHDLKALPVVFDSLSLKPLEPDSSWKPLGIDDSSIIAGKYLIPFEINGKTFFHEGTSTGDTIISGSAVLDSSDSMLTETLLDTIPPSIKEKKFFYTREEILADSTRDLDEPNVRMDELIADLGYNVGDTIPFVGDFQNIQVDSFLFIKTEPVIVEVFDSSRIVKQRPVNELIKETEGKLAVTEKILIKGEVYFKVFYPDENDVYIEMVRVKGGEFNMGSYEFDEDEQPVYTVKVSNYLISKYEVTNYLFAIFMSLVGCDSIGCFEDIKIIDLLSRDTKINWSRHDGRFVPDNGYEEYPVVNVTWDGAQLFCFYMGRGRLPSEAEWEYAARGGIYALRYYTNKREDKYDYYHRFSGGNTMAELGWFVDNSRGYCHKKGLKNPNRLGIYDMSGNVWEWCFDNYNAKYYWEHHNKTDPVCKSGTGSRVNRGGSWSNDAQYCRITNRNYLTQSGCNKFLGFRYMRNW